MNESNASLNQIREKINEIDKKILALLSQRRQCSVDVAKTKLVSQKPIRDLGREQQLLAELVAIGQNHQLDATYIHRIFQLIIEDSVLTQQDFLQKEANLEEYLPELPIAFLGSKGSYSHLAATRFLSRKPHQLVEIECNSFKAVINAVETNKAYYGILPIENTSSGSINEAYDELQHTHLFIVSEITQPIVHSLLGVESADLDKITTIYSHPQPYQQCSELLNTLENIRYVACSSTTEAMQMVANMQDPTIGAIGNNNSGQLYGLRTLKTDIANQSENYTRFIVVARKPVQVSTILPAKTTLIIRTGQKAGSLVDSLLVLKKHQINMTKLESRPVLGNPWEEMFYLDIEGNTRNENVKKAIDELSKVTHQIKVLGCYPSEDIHPVDLAD